MILKVLKYILIVFILVFLSSCGSSQDNLKTIQSNMTEKIEKLDTYYAIVTTKMIFNGETEESAYQEWANQLKQFRVQYEDGLTFVTNGTISWVYDRDLNEVMIQEASDMESMPNQTELLTEIMKGFIEREDLQLISEEKELEKETFHLANYSQGDTKDVPLEKVDYWIDKKSYLPVKIVKTSMGFRSELVYKKIEIDKRLSDDFFDFQIPENAKVISLNDLMPKIMSLDEVKEAAGFYVPEITQLPKGYILSESYFDKSMNNAIFIFYKGEEMTNMIELSVKPQNEELPEFPDVVKEEVRLGNKTPAFLYEIDGMKVLVWKLDNATLQFSTMGEELSRDEFIKVAGSIK